MGREHSMSLRFQGIKKISSEGAKLQRMVMGKMAVQEVMKFTGSDQVKKTGDQNQVGEIEEYRDERKEEDLCSWTETKDKRLMTNLYFPTLNIAKKLQVNFSPTWKQSKSENAGSAMIYGIHESALILVVNILSLRVGKAIAIFFDCMASRFRLQIQSSMIQHLQGGKRHGLHAISLKGRMLMT